MGLRRAVREFFYGPDSHRSPRPLDLPPEEQPFPSAAGAFVRVDGDPRKTTVQCPRCGVRNPVIVTACLDCGMENPAVYAEGMRRGVLGPPPPSDEWLAAQNAREEEYASRYIADHEQAARMRQHDRVQADPDDSAERDLSAREAVLRGIDSAGDQLRAELDRDRQAHDVSPAAPICSAPRGALWSCATRPTHRSPTPPTPKSCGAWLARARRCPTARWRLPLALHAISVWRPVRFPVLRSDPICAKCGLEDPAEESDRVDRAAAEGEVSTEQVRDAIAEYDRNEGSMVDSAPFTKESVRALILTELAELPVVAVDGITAIVREELSRLLDSLDSRPAPEEEAAPATSTVDEAGSIPGAAGEDLQRLLVQVALAKGELDRWIHGPRTAKQVCTARTVLREILQKHPRR